MTTFIDSTGALTRILLRGCQNLGLIHIQTDPRQLRLPQNYAQAQSGRLSDRPLQGSPPDAPVGLKAKAPRRYKVTTDSRHGFAVAPNVLNRNFQTDSPNKAWTADITYVWTLKGWLHLAVVMDLYSRQVVGWAMNKRIKKQLTLDALAMAYWQRKPASGLIHHSDRGSQYACHEYQKRIRQYGMIPSMSRKGDCWDNAPMERFFRSLKSERLSACRFETRSAARAEILDYITFYNADRLHSAIGYLSPMEYEKDNYKKWRKLLSVFCCPLQWNPVLKTTAIEAKLLKSQKIFKAHHNILWLAFLA